jgi:hypothetical protein
MARRWLFSEFAQFADLTGLAELDPDRDAELLLHPTYDDPLLDGDDDPEHRHEVLVRRWTTWLAS